MKETPNQRYRTLHTLLDQLEHKIAHLEQERYSLQRDYLELQNKKAECLFHLQESLQLMVEANRLLKRKVADLEDQLSCREKKL